MTKDAPQDEVRLDTVLRNTAAELRDLKRIAEEVDDAVGAWLNDDNTGKTPVAILQRVDFLRQSIDCFEVLFRNLSQMDIPENALPIKVLSSGIYLENIRAICRRDLADRIPGE
jgi:hypothetical protein